MQELETEPTDERIEARRTKLLARLNERYTNNQNSALPSRHQQLDTLLAQAREQITKRQVDGQTLKLLEEQLSLDTTSRQARWVQDALQQMRQISLEAKTVEANGSAKTKGFSFKLSQSASGFTKTAAKPTPAIEKTIEGAENETRQTKESRFEQLPEDERTVVVKDLHNSTRQLSGENGRDVRICDVHGGRLSFSFRPATVYIKNVTDCTLVFLPVKTSVLLYDCANLNLHAAAQQIRVHSSHSLSLHVWVPSPGAVIIEDCTAIRLAPFRLRQCVPDSPSPNEFWRKVSDFNWLAEGPSPNWCIASEAEWVEESIELN